MDKIMIVDIPNCIKCKGLTKILDKAGIEYEKMLLEDFENEYSKFIKHFEAPLVACLTYVDELYTNMQWYTGTKAIEYVQSVVRGKQNENK